MEIIRAHHPNNLYEFRKLGIERFAAQLPGICEKVNPKYPRYTKELWGDRASGKMRFTAAVVGYLSRILSLPDREEALVCGLPDRICGLAIDGKHCRQRLLGDYQCLGAIFDMTDHNPDLVIGDLRLVETSPDKNPAILTNVGTVKRLVDYAVETDSYFSHD